MTPANLAASAPPTVLAGWDAFRAQLGNHHSAEDNDLWPVLRRELSDPAELATVDASQHDMAAVLTEMPPPARLIYRRVLRPRYDAQHRWQIPSPP